jgi:uncharacterized protein
MLPVSSANVDSVGGKVTVDMNVLLQGIVGSTAYGLSTPDSDVDRLGVFAFPTQALHGLHCPAPTHTTTKPDATWHEAGKYAKLMLGGNPTAFELLYLPDEFYEIRNPLGDDLINIRSAFLSAKRVRDSYLGYATQQFRKLEKRADGTFSSDTRNRTAKHARHLFRLLDQGSELYRTGWLRVRLDDDVAEECQDFGDRVADGELDLAKQVLSDAEVVFYRSTKLPEYPDEPKVERWLLDVRDTFFYANMPEEDDE